MTPTQALYARIHGGGGLARLLPQQELVRMRVQAQDWGAYFEALHARALASRCECRNGQLFEPLHHHSIHRRGSAFANRQEVPHVRM